MRIAVCLYASLILFHPLSAAEYRIGNHSFTLPDGFTVELVAGPPLVDRPMMADFDEQGRLYVADSAGINDNVRKQLEEKPHRIVRLEDSDGDGRFDKSVVFADRMMFPEGVLWLNGAVYSGAPPVIWKLQDTDNDGVADRRTEWFNGGTLTGCANDLHGPYLGPDGWIYWCKGAFAKQTHERPGSKPISDSAAHIFRRRPDGTAFDSVISGGMDNPVEIAFTPAGEAFFTTTFYSHPEAGQRDALVHVIYGGVYPKTHGVLDGLVRTGDLMPAMTHLGPAVPSGLMRYTSAVFGEEYQGNLFSTQFNLHKVQRHSLEPDGATFRTRDLDFLVSNNPDFHPTDVLEDADGSLLVIDTGGWYKICCPTSQLAKPDVLGAIYRIRRVGTSPPSDPRGLKLNWLSMKPSGLCRLLDDARPVVRSRAISELAARGEPSVPALQTVLRISRSIQARCNAVWALTRIDGIAARTAVRAALVDNEPTVQQAAAHSAGAHRDSGSIAKLVALLDSDRPHVKRAAATALGQIGDEKAVPRLLAAASVPHDRVLEHALIYALIQIASPERTAAGLEATSPYARRAALIALDQMEGGTLNPMDVAPLLMSTNSILKQTAGWIISHRPEWGNHLADHFAARLRAPDLSPEDGDELEDQLAQLARNDAIQALVETYLTNPASSEPRRMILLRAMARTSLKEMPKHWHGPLVQALQSADPRIARSAVAVLKALPPNKADAQSLNSTLLALAEDEANAPDLRLEALAALQHRFELQPKLVHFLFGYLQPNQPPLDRSRAASILGRAILTEEQVMSLAERMKTAGPLEISHLLPAFEKRPITPIGERLLDALESGRASNSLRPDLLRPLLLKFSEPVQQRGERLLSAWNQVAEEQKARLDQLEAGLKAGDIRRGQSIFNSANAACSTCHRVGYLGGRIGPDLTKIGAVRTERDLLESILFPSATFVRSYEPMIVITRDGEQHHGVLHHENDDRIRLVTGAGTEQRFDRTDIVELHPGTISTMPEGLDQQLSEQELADLVAFLKSLK